jgi:hypothetical protein
MNWCTRYHLPLWLAALAVGPGLLLDLLAIGPMASGGWQMMMGLALCVGFPYYFAQLLIGVVAPAAPMPAYAIGAAVLVFALGIGVDRWLQRRGRVRGAGISETAS